VDVQDQAIRPCLECAKVSYRFRTNWHVRFNLDSHVVAVAKKKSFHLFDCVGLVPHVVESHFDLEALPNDFGVSKVILCKERVPAL
jgi:hypothetical protein